MTRSDLAARLSLKLRISKEEADRYLLSFVDAIITGLQRDKKVVVQGFGSFRVREYRERMGKKPLSGELIRIPNRRKPAFHAGKELRAMINRPAHKERVRPRLWEMALAAQACE